MFGVRRRLFGQWRNRLPFQDNFIFPLSLAQVIRSHMEKIIKASSYVNTSTLGGSCTSLVLVKCDPPPSGLIKPNINGAFKGNPRLASSGNLFINERVAWPLSRDSH